MNAKRPRRLDLNAPLLSTRRSIVTTLELSRTNSLCGSCDRVPFSWEQSPGKPKDAVRRDCVRYEGLPLPLPPPIRWQEEPYSTGIDCDDNSNSSSNNNNNNYNNDAFSDVIDLFSLAPSLNPSERPDMESANEEDTDLESDIGGNNGSRLSPNFMIQRFLPAATALATSSLLSLGAKEGDLSTTNKHLMSRYLNKTSEVTSLERSCVPRVVGQKGCGLQLLFPWRAKHKISRLKNPIKRVHIPT